MLELLMRGGSFGHFWFKQSKRTIWWAVDEGSPSKQAQFPQEDTYFGVNPSAISKGSSERTTTKDIEAINCLYADIDAKEFNDDKSEAADHVRRLDPSPSIIVDSGGGYHCYWLLKKPLMLKSDFVREAAEGLQKQWVRYVRGDPAVHDLARILRLPGTLNYKYDPPRQVTILYSNSNRTYSLDELQEFLPEDEHSGGGVASSVPKPAKPNRLSAQDIADKIMASSEAQKFKSLWTGSNDGYQSASEADLALCCILAFWTGGDYAKIDRMFRASARMRSKWDRDKYRHDTLIKALAQVTEYYQDPAGYLTAAASDEGNARCAYERNKHSHLYCPALGWMFFNGKYWNYKTAEAETDKMLLESLRQRRIAAAAGGDEIDEKYREAILRATKGEARVLRNCASIYKSLATVPISEFDTSLDELNCPNGVLDLRTGKLSRHSPSKRFTYCVAVPYNEDADQSPWVEWLTEAVGGKPEVVKFLQQAVGYSLTGHIREEIAFYIYGPARAGKGVFTETLIKMFGAYNLATEVPMDMFVERRSASDQGFALASLKSARFVVASETKESQWLNAPKLKTWTGGNIVRCAHKYGHPFSYVPQFKIWLTSNFALQMDVEDDAGWARIQVIQFPNSYLGRENKLLKGYMGSKDVLKGVFAWAVQGAVEWYELPKGGLRAPQIIAEETQKAREQLDLVGQWVREEILITGAKEDKIPNSVYYQRYADWCEEQGVNAKKSIALNKALKRAGHQVGLPFTKDGKTQRGWIGAKLVGLTYRESLARISFEDDEDG